MTLPITAVVPTRNSAGEIDEHITDLNAWIENVEAVIVVDSESTDGTVERLRRELRHPRLTWMSRPPGLYAAWNAAIAAADSEFVYMATVGDSTDLSGMNRLHDVGREYSADVVLSPPRIIGPDGFEISGASWPIHKLLNIIGTDRPFVMKESQAFALANAFGIQGLLGSSASNLYRTEVMKLHPFPTNVGHAGDTAWGCRNALRVRIAVCPAVCANFVHARSNGILADSECAAQEVEFLSLAEAAIAEGRGAERVDLDIITEASLLCVGWKKSRHWMLEQVLHSEQILATSEQRMAYIGELQKDGDARLVLIDEQASEIKRLHDEVARLIALTPANRSVWSRIRSLIR